MRDTTFLEWPFFDDAHRALARDLATWAEGESHPHDDVDVVVRRWTRALGRGGWLQALLQPLDVRALCIARETLAYRSALGDFAAAMQGLCAAPIARFGTSSQRAQWLPQLLSGEALGAFALSEREAGSDVAAIATRARRDGDAYVIDGEKTWISNAGIADRYVVFARTSDDRRGGLTAFVVDAGTAGLERDERIETISPHPLGTLRFAACRVPAAHRLGDEGQGFAIAMSTLEVFRPSVGAAAVGFARRALSETLARVKERRIFGAPLADLQMTQASVAQMAADVDASALLVYRAAWAKDRGRRIDREGAMAKWFATEAAGRVADRAVQLFGGRGVTRGEIVERIYRDVRALRIYEGANEIQQLIVARHALRDTAP